MSDKPSAKITAAKFGAIGFMAVALGCAALAAFLIGDMMTSKYTGTRVVPVVVAKVQLHAGMPIAAEDLEVKEWPETAAPAGSYATVDALLEANKDATPTVGILPGEPVVSARLSNAKSGTGIAALIKPNMRAISLRVADAVGYTGLVYPGAYVDVIATIRDPMGRGPSSRVAVQHARVLSLGMDADVATRKIREEKADKLTGSQKQGGTFVTLEVTPDEAEVLSIARNEGKIDLVLRNATDDAIVDTAGATPVEVSAFAEEAQAEEDAALADKDKGKSKGRTRTRPARVRHQNKRIQIVAHDEKDVAPPPPRKIETYNAN